MGADASGSRGILFAKARLDEVGARRSRCISKKSFKAAEKRAKDTKPRRGDPLVRAMTPIAPADARWQISRWDSSMCNWRHFAFARSKVHGRELAREVTAMGGKVRYHQLISRDAANKPARIAAVSAATVAADGRPTHTKSRGTFGTSMNEQNVAARQAKQSQVASNKNSKSSSSRSTTTRSSATRSTTTRSSSPHSSNRVAYRRKVVRSLFHWMDVAARAALESQLPHEDIKVLRDKIFEMVSSRLARHAPDRLADPLA